MKILKDETYNSLTKQIKELKEENTELEIHNDKQSNILRNNRKEFASFVTDAKMTFSIKRLVVGRKRSGKTTFIKTMLPKIPNYFIIDTNNEYLEVEKEKKFVPDKELKLEDLQEQIKKAIIDNRGKTLIIEETATGESFTQWFLLNSRDVNFILVSQCKRRLEPFINDVDFIYDFGTADNFREVIDANKIMKFEQKKDNLVTNKSNSYNSANTGIVALGIFSIFTLGLVALAGR